MKTANQRFERSAQQRTRCWVPSSHRSSAPAQPNIPPDLRDKATQSGECRRWVLEQLDPRHSRAMIQMNIGREVSRRLRVADKQLFRVRMGEPDIDPAVVFPST